MFLQMVASAPITFSNLACRSSAGANEPLLPHKSLRCSSVLNRSARSGSSESESSSLASGSGRVSSALIL